MKKSRLSLGLVTTFIATLSLSACYKVLKEQPGSIVTFKNYKGETVDLITSDFYNKYRGTTDGITKFYNQILEVLIRYDYSNGTFDGQSNMKSLAQIKEEADDQVKEQKETAEKNAKSQGITYSDAWDNILDNYKVDNAEQLKEIFIYNLEKAEVDDWFLNEKTNIAKLTDEFIGVKNDGTAVASDVRAAMPYHIRHILVKVEDGGSNFATGTISDTQAKKLAVTVNRLVSGKESFGEVAYYQSEDSSNTSYGDVGIMTNKATTGSLAMVNEFQLGIYAYDAIYNELNANKGNEVINKGLGLTGEYKKTTKTIAEKLTDRGLVEVPYKVFEELGNVAKLDSDTAGYELSNGSTKLFPRNILWNKYLNHHDVFVITNRVYDAGAYNLTNLGEGENNIMMADTATYDNTVGSRFVDFGTTGRKVLCDEQGRPIIGVRSTFGIHFMVMEKSIFNYNDNLTNYYTVKVPGEEGYPTTGTYVDLINGSKADYNTRATTVKEAIKAFDTTYSYRLFDFLTQEHNVSYNEVNGVSIGEEIKTYIKNQKENNAFNQDEGINGVWQTYLELLESQDANRTNARMVPEGCKIGFKQYLSEEELKAYKEGGECYYAN